MDGVPEVVARLEAAGTGQDRRTWQRRGARDPMLGEGSGGTTGAGAHA